MMKARQDQAILVRMESGVRAVQVSWKAVVFDERHGSLVKSELSTAKTLPMVKAVRCRLPEATDKCVFAQMTPKMQR